MAMLIKRSINFRRLGQHPRDLQVLRSRVKSGLVGCCQRHAAELLRDSARPTQRVHLRREAGNHSQDRMRTCIWRLHQVSRVIISTRWHRPRCHPTHRPALRLPHRATNQENQSAWLLRLHKIHF